jgi:hypothetical protein
VATVGARHEALHRNEPRGCNGTCNILRRRHPDDHLRAHYIPIMDFASAHRAGSTLAAASSVTAFATGGGAV